ncbi:TlyA family RNA methyltransferase [Gulosibacter sp. 10]|uniref:TlyA family RNA methyltransferase n=1 Tax=Gulosibacter sp. 10 TaxID=1255570 RepID=UPI00097F5983|nr:TlyA family RNA methyltransferase [Gulosibacter sp. 10]SJM47511.1 RNA binding methyltransferase FtsJ like [Gulosibacter sp. 10]
MGRRLDRALAERGLARSRTAAARLIADGAVRVNGEPATRAARTVDEHDELAVVEPDRYVSRAAHKLLDALDAFGIDVRGSAALDLGASTGGFTQVLLERGARAVVALDVGHDQLDPLIRADARVTAIEGENARHLDRARLDRLLQAQRRDRPPLRAEEIALATGDLSFISLRHIVPVLPATLPALRDVVLLVKPQFEVGRAHVRGGIVTDPQVAAERAIDVLREAREAGLRPRGFRPSPVRGTHGNAEYLLWCSADDRPGGTTGTDASEWEDRVRSTIMEGAA